MMLCKTFCSTNGPILYTHCHNANRKSKDSGRKEKTSGPLTPKKRCNIDHEDHSTHRFLLIQKMIQHVLMMFLSSRQVLMPTSYITDVLHIFLQKKAYS